MGLVCWLLVLLPAVFGFLYVRAFGVSVVFTDAWSMVPLFDGWYSGTLGISDLWAPHNEHRMLFPKAFELALGLATGYDNVAEMYVIEACFLLTLAALMLAFAEGARPRPAGAWYAGAWPLLFLPISLLVFNLRQYENMLLGFQINFAFTQAFGVLALFLLRLFARGRPRKAAPAAFAAAVARATVASFSTAQGLLVWPAGLVGLLVGPSPAGRPGKGGAAAAWVICGLAEWVLYFVDYSPPGGGSISPLRALSSPAAGAEYFLNLLGSSMFWQQRVAFAGGGVLLLLIAAGLAVVAKDRAWARQSFWVSLLCYSLLMLSAIAAGRSGTFGPWQALAPRYTTFSLLAVASAYAVLAKAALFGGEARGPGEGARGRAAPLLAACGATLIAGAVLYGAAVSYPTGLEAGRATEAARERAVLVLPHYEACPRPVLAATFGTRAGVVKKRAPVLERLDLNVFSGRNPSEASELGAAGNPEVAPC